jgi:hypothetical protein
VFGSNGGLRDLVYVRMPNNATRGIPAWMFDESICASVRCADRATITPDGPIFGREAIEKYYEACSSKSN